MKYKVRFTATFETWVECDKEDLQDAICDVNIPEDNETKYVSDTIELESVEDEDGNEVET